MTTTKEAAGLVQQLRDDAVEISGWGAGNEAGRVRQAAATIAALLAQVEELLRERDTWKEIAEKTAASGSSISRKLDTAKAQLAEAEAGIAEAVKAMKPFATFAGDRSIPKSRSFLQLLVCPEGDAHPQDYGPHFAAARAFVEKHKESKL